MNMFLLNHVLAWACSHLSTFPLEHVPTWACSHLSMCPLEHVPTWARAHLSRCPLEHVPTWACSLLSTFPLEHVPTWARSHLSTFPHEDVLAAYYIPTCEPPYPAHLNIIKRVPALNFMSKYSGGGEEPAHPNQPRTVPANHARCRISK